MTDKRTSTAFLPPFPLAIFPTGRVAFHIRDVLYGKIATQKKLVHLYTWEIFGKVYNYDV